MAHKIGLWEKEKAPFELQKGRRIQLNYIIPMDDLVLLIAFHDNELQMNDVVFLVNRVEDFRPCSHPEQLASFLRENPNCIAQWEQEIGSATPEPGEDDPEITLDIPPDLLEDLMETCHKLEVTVEQLIRAMLRFIVDPNSKEAASQWSGLKLDIPDKAETDHQSEMDHNVNKEKGEL